MIFYAINFRVLFTIIIPLYLVMVFISQIIHCHGNYDILAFRQNNLVYHKMHIRISFPNALQLFAIQINLRHTEIRINGYACHLRFPVLIPALGQVKHGLLAPISFIPIVSIFLYFRSKVTNPFIFRDGILLLSHMGQAKSKVFHKLRSNNIKGILYHAPLVFMGFSLKGLWIKTFSPIKRFSPKLCFILEIQI